MKKASIFFGAFLCVSATVASASSQDVRGAYDAALKCFVANGYLKGTFEKSGDSANASLFDARAHKAFDLAFSYGDMLHLSQQQVKADISRTSDPELRKLLTDGSYLTVIAKDCKYWGMM